MKNTIGISIVIQFILTIILIHSCETEKLPVISTTVATAISYTTATSEEK